ncbi:MAG: VTT domain-containing protein [Vicinamibacterales bacterium]|jgi:membrane protein YqaA with SNARE-associated domain|nr:VTT domain-containing protein [Vicinamibacterales bacterium]
MDGFRDSLLALGLPGLFLIALLDSAGVPLPGGVDIVLMLLSWQQPSLFVVVALTAALGSTIGCLALYRVGRTGGEMAVRRLDPERRRWVTNKVRENDILAMLVAVLAPPPFPTKVFVLVAGFVGMPWPRFAATVFAGRLLRFTGEAYLAVRLGDAAFDTLQRYYPLIGAGLAVGVVTFLAVKWLRKRRAINATG